jgi:phosphate/sulfate permease
MEIFGLTLLAAITIVMTLGFDFVNGFNDSANSISTVVATKVLTPFQAVSMAAVFNFMGIFLWPNIATTVGTGIIDKDLLNRAKHVAMKAGYASLEEFVAHALEREIARLEVADTEREVERELRGLGYVG